MQKTNNFVMQNTIFIFHKIILKKFIIRTKSNNNFKMKSLNFIRINKILELINNLFVKIIFEIQFTVINFNQNIEIILKIKSINKILFTLSRLKLSYYSVFSQFIEKSKYVDNKIFNYSLIFNNKILNANYTEIIIIL